MSGLVFGKIRQLVASIPLGKVTTYGCLADYLHTTPQVIGWALRGNENILLPCHRVVKSNGTLAKKFSLGNWPEQRRRLQSEGIDFVGNKITDLKKVFYDFKT